MSSSEQTAGETRYQASLQVQAGRNAPKTHKRHYEFVSVCAHGGRVVRIMISLVYSCCRVPDLTSLLRYEWALEHICVCLFVSACVCSSQQSRIGLVELAGCFLCEGLGLMAPRHTGKEGIPVENHDPLSVQRLIKLTVLKTDSNRLPLGLPWTTAW